MNAFVSRVGNGLVVGLLLVATVQAQAPTPAGDDAAAGLNAQLQSAREQSLQIERRAAQWRERLEAMRLKVDGVMALPANAPEPVEKPEPKGARKVPFRPPLERDTDKNAIGCLCINGKLSLLYYSAVGPEVNRLNGKPGSFDLPGGEFRCDAEFVPQRGPAVTVNRIPNTEHLAESIQQLGQTSSKFQKMLAEQKSSELYLEFIVYPDSYDLFRQARTIAWQKGYETNWNPKVSGAKIVLGAGAGSVQ